MKKKKLRKIIKALKMEIARLEELNKQGLSDELERGFNDLLNTGVSVSGPLPVHVDENMLSSEEIAAVYQRNLNKQHLPSQQEGVYQKNNPLPKFGMNG